MSGVKVGTRLEQLHALRRQVEQEIAQERHRVWLATPSPRTRLRQLGRKTEGEATALMQDLGVTSRIVKEWSVTAGLNTEIPRGRVSLALVKAYAEGQAATSAASAGSASTGTAMEPFISS